jgi:hypothetical protein
MRWLTSAVLVLAALGCSEERARTGPVEIHGVLHEIMAEGRTEGRIGVAEVAAHPHTYALGALAGLDGEVTIVDSEVWLSRPSAAAGDRAEISITRTPPPDARATLLVATRVPHWLRVPLAPAADAVALAESIETHARARGLDLEQPFPFLLEGPVRALGWHVVDGRRIQPGGGHASHLAASIRGELAAGTRVTVVGFYSRAHEGVFTHMGERIHLHVISRSPRATGHVDHLATAEGMTLSLPSVPSGS